MLEAAAIVLAGGKSTRMGRDKAFVRVEERRLIEEAVHTLRAGFPEIYISSNNNFYRELDVITVPDIYDGRGPLGGIHACLKSSPYHINFIVACDMPFINPSLAAYLVECCNGYDGAVPKIDNYFQPLFAVYTKNCVPVIEKQLEKGINKIASFFSQLKIRFIGPEEIIKYGDPKKLFFNVNTPDDLKLAKNMAGRETYGPEV